MERSDISDREKASSKKPLRKSTAFSSQISLSGLAIHRLRAFPLSAAIASSTALNCSQLAGALKKEEALFALFPFVDEKFFIEKSPGIAPQFGWGICWLCCLHIAHRALQALEKT